MNDNQDKKYKSKKNQNSEDKYNSTSYFNLFSKLLNPFKILIKLHIKVAKKELKKDFARYLTGLLLLFLGLFSLIIMFFLTNILIVLLIKYYIFKNFGYMVDYIYSFLAAVILNFSFFLLMLALAFSKFKKPFLQETKKAVEQTIKDLK